MSAIDRVRSATRAVQKSFEEHLLIIRFMQDGNVESYRGFLEAFRSVVALALLLCEEYLEKSDRDVIDYREWRVALEHDLLALEPLHQDEYVPNISTLVPSINSRSECWGLVYVLEASLAGGREVAKTMDEEWPEEFLLRGSQNRLRWSFFMRRLSQMERASVIFPDGVERGAVKTFEALIEMFDEYEHSHREPEQNDYSPSPQ